MLLTQMAAAVTVVSARGVSAQQRVACAACTSSGQLCWQRQVRPWLGTLQKKKQTNNKARQQDSVIMRQLKHNG
jgi:hypothetical protein